MERRKEEGGRGSQQKGALEEFEKNEGRGRGD
jgi:hypothetical protein